MRMHKSPDTSKFAGNLSLVNPLICAQSLADNFTDGITTGKNDNPTFFWLSDSEKLKKYLLGWQTRTKDISDAGVMQRRLGEDQN